MVAELIGHLTEAGFDLVRTEVPIRGGFADVVGYLGSGVFSFLQNELGWGPGALPRAGLRIFEVKTAIERNRVGSGLRQLGYYSQAYAGGDVSLHLICAGRVTVAERVLVSSAATPVHVWERRNFDCDHPEGPASYWDLRGEPCHPAYAALF